MAHRMTDIASIPTASSPVDGLDWRPVRRHLGIGSFGTNAYIGRQAGDLVIEPHDEDEFEELYVVLSGAARFTVDGETFDAPQGALVFVTPPSQRVAHATAPDTTILVAGAVPGRAYEVSEWEERWLAES